MFVPPILYLNNEKQQNVCWPIFCEEIIHLQASSIENEKYAATDPIINISWKRSLRKVIEIYLKWFNPECFM